MLAAVSLYVNEVIPDPIDGVGTGFAKGVGKRLIEVHLRVAGQSTLIVVVAKDSSVGDLALSKWLSDLEDSLGIHQIVVTREKSILTLCTSGAVSPLT